MKRAASGAIKLKKIDENELSRSDQMNYEQAIDYWYGLVNYEKTPPLRDDLRLDQMKTLAGELGNPQDRLRIVHVAGSKGKGSTAAMLATILQHAGHVTGLFTSPHLRQVEERVQINRSAISKHELTDLLVAVRSAAEAADVQPTFFEVATAAAFLHFARKAVDIAVLEVGLGGRFDSTNICTPLVSVITSISLDHSQVLGDRLSSIAMEKAGIIKPGRPAVSGATVLEARTVIEAISGERNAPLTQLDVDFRFTHKPGQVPNDVAKPMTKARMRIMTAHHAWPEMELALLGEHQAANAAVALATLEQLDDQSVKCTDDAVATGFASISWPGRMEVVKTRPLVVLDCAHNVASVHAFIDTLMASFPPLRRRLIFAASDKDLRGMLQVLAPHFEHIYFTRSTNRRSAEPAELADCVRRRAQPVIRCARLRKSPGRKP